MIRGLFLLALAGCTQPDYTSGRMRCATTGRACPDDFYCAPDGLCWRTGTGPDLGMNGDLAVSDLAMEDAALSDLSGPVVDLLHVDAAPSLCAALSVNVCDGFEAPTLNARWTESVNNGGINVDNTRAYRGASSLHVSTAATAAAGASPHANLITYDGMPINTTLYARVFAWVPSTNNHDPFGQVLNFANGSGQGNAIAIENGRVVNNDYAGPTVFRESMTVSMPRDRWVCLEMEINQATATGTVKIFVDENEVTDITLSGAPTPVYTHVYLGLDWSNTPANFGAQELWLDEIIIDDQPTSCAQ
jgi:hypothetical protein